MVLAGLKHSAQHSDVKYFRRRHRALTNPPLILRTSLPTERERACRCIAMLDDRAKEKWKRMQYTAKNLQF